MVSVKKKYIYRSVTGYDILMPEEKTLYTNPELSNSNL